MIKYLNRITSIQNTVGAIALVVLFVVTALAASWGITCLFIYWISLLWAGTVFAFEWSWSFATGVWLALCLLCSVSVKVNDH